jgi:hypothetical protein
MPTPRFRSQVSLAAALTFSLALAGCAGSPSRVASQGPTPAEQASRTVRFDNEARDHVHVYLVGEKREWLLGRVEPGARATLRIPEDALAGDPRSMQLVVLTGERMTLRAAGAARAATSIQQPATAILSQRWSFSRTLGSGQLASFQLGRPAALVSRQ